MCVAFAPLLRSVAGQLRTSSGPPCLKFPVCCAARRWNQTVSPGVAARPRNARDVGDGRPAVCKRGLCLTNAVRLITTANWASWADTLPMIRPRYPEVAETVWSQLGSTHQSGATLTGANGLASTLMTNSQLSTG